MKGFKGSDARYIEQFVSFVSFVFKKSNPCYPGNPCFKKVKKVEKV